MAIPTYKESVSRLFSDLRKIHHVIFIHGSFFANAGDETEPTEEYDDDPYSYHFELPDLSVINYVNGLMEQFDLNVVVYRSNAELSVMASSFIDQNEKNLIFRIYIPSGKMWSLEAEKLLQLFRDYLLKVSRLNIRQDQRQTKQGMVYELFGDHPMNPSTLPKEFDDFSRFLDLCISNPYDATQMLLNKSVDSSYVYGIIERYGKEARRLQVDLKHERDKKLLSIRHRMESELVDMVVPDADWQAINHLIESSVPSIVGIGSSIGFDTVFNENAATTTQTIININPQIINTVKGFVAHHITGNQSFGVEANQLLDLISQYGGQHKSDLTSAIHEFEDKDAKINDRLSAKQKIKSFLYKIANKTSDIAITVLQKYIETKLNL